MHCHLRRGNRHSPSRHNRPAKAQSIHQKQCARTSRLTRRAAQITRCTTKEQQQQHQSSATLGMDVAELSVTAELLERSGSLDGKVLLPQASGAAAAAGSAAAATTPGAESLYQVGVCRRDLQACCMEPTWPYLPLSSSSCLPRAAAISASLGAADDCAACRQQAGVQCRRQRSRGTASQHRTVTGPPGETAAAFIRDRPTCMWSVDVQQGTPCMQCVLH